MTTEFRAQLVQAATAYLEGDISFAELHRLANDLLPEFEDDSAANTLAGEVLLAEVNGLDDVETRATVAEALRVCSGAGAVPGS
jgi:hypothetical protein